MIKITLIFLFLLLSNVTFSNEVEVIELHENKSLDQIVLDQLNDDTTDKMQSDDLILDNEDISNQTNENQNTVVDELEIDKDSFWATITTEQLNKYLQNNMNLKSNILQTELSNFLELINLDYSIKKNREIFYLITNYFYQIGDISKAYNLLNTRDLSNDEKNTYYATIELNYLLSTFQLEQVCEYKKNYSLDINLDNFILEKIDIFCLVLNQNFLEAELLNSILIDSEKELDEDFQRLYLILINNLEEDKSIKYNFDNNLNTDLIFLYSAMLRIADLPLSESFLNLDSKNLAIPIILNQSSPIELRLKAANKSFKNKNLSVESLAALYQSVDFDSEQLNDPEKFLNEFSNSIEISMAYYFQYINIQIFPKDRLDALINFWNFAIENNLEEIAYSLSYKIVQSIDISSDNLQFSPHIATCYIINKDFDKAAEWIEFFEITNEIKDEIYFTKVLLDLYSSSDINSIIKNISSNFEIFSNENSTKNNELIYVLLKILDNNEYIDIDENLNSIFDDRSFPSIFVIEKIKETINSNDMNKFLIYSTISINNKEWKDIHPEHLKILLNGFMQYDDEITRNIIIEIFKNYKIL